MNEGCRVRVTGPLAGYADGFRDELAAQGYTVQVRDRQLRMLAHVSRWLAGQGLSVAELTPGSRMVGSGAGAVALADW